MLLEHQRKWPFKGQRRPWTVASRGAEATKSFSLLVLLSITDLAQSEGLVGTTRLFLIGEINADDKNGDVGDDD